MDEQVTIFIVDDDPSIRHSLTWLLESAKLHVESFASAEDFLQQVDPDHAGCLLLDVRMPGMSGLQLQEALLEREATLPIIMLTGHGDVPMAVRAMAKGCFDFMQKPFNGPQLLEKVKAAIALSHEALAQKRACTTAHERYRELTRRERQVMDLIVQGMANKVIAHELDVSLRTVEVHRHRVMEKMHARSVADLIHSDLLLKKE